MGMEKEMNKIKITCSQPVRWNAKRNPQKTFTYTHKEGGEKDVGRTVAGFCAYLVGQMQYHKLNKFTIEVLDE